MTKSSEVFGKGYSLADIVSGAHTIMSTETENNYKLTDFLKDAEEITRIKNLGLEEAEEKRQTTPLLNNTIDYALGIVDGKPAEQIWMRRVLSEAVGQRPEGEISRDLLNNTVNGLLGAALDLSIYRSGGYTPDNSKRSIQVRDRLGLPSIAVNLDNRKLTQSTAKR